MKKDNLLLVLAKAIEEKVSAGEHHQQVVLERTAFFVELDNAASVKCMHECVAGIFNESQMKQLNGWLKSKGYFV